MLINQAKAGPYTLKLLERPSPFGGEFFAPRYYFTISHEEGPWLTAVAFLGHDRGQSVRQFERRRDNQLASFAAESDSA